MLLIAIEFPNLPCKMGGVRAVHALPHRMIGLNGSFVCARPFMTSEPFL